jgi:quinol monooxygenase YgiN
MTASEGEASASRAALEALLARVERLAGCQAVDLPQDTGNADIFVLLERWTTAEANREGGKLPGKEAFAPIMAVLGSSPEAASLSTLD